VIHASHALSAPKTQQYFREEYSATDKRYFSQDNNLRGFWHGQLASELGLTGPVEDQAFDRLALGQDPKTGEQWIAFRDTVLTKTGHESAHRAAWDLTMHAPKSVSLAALVGGDERIIRAHEGANRVAMDAMERQVQARMGGNHVPVTTEKWIAATFLHDTARPMDIQLATGEKIAYPAPHLHSHNVVFNLTEDFAGQARSLQTKAIFEAQTFGTAVYRSELAIRLKELGYEVFKNEAGAPEIRGFTKEYLAAESLRSSDIRDRLEQLGLSGARAREIIAHQDRNAKLVLTKEELRALHQAHAEQFGNQAQQIVKGAQQRGASLGSERELSAHEAVSFAIRRLSERESVIDHYQVARDALNYGQGSLRLPEVEAEIARRRVGHVQDLGNGRDLLTVSHVRTHAPGARYTTPEQLVREKNLIDIVHRGIGSAVPLAPGLTKEDVRTFKTPDGHSLNHAQTTAVWAVLSTQDRVFALQGVAGSGKTTSLRVIREQAEANGYEVRGLAPTSTATKELNEAGIKSGTLQLHLKHDSHRTADDFASRLYLLDESSLASSAQVHSFITKIRPQDRVLLVGDTRQHQSIEAGRIFSQLQDAGMTTHQLNHIVRQKSNPELLAAVRHLADGRVPEALTLLEEQGRIHEVLHRKERFAAIATAYAESPDKTLVVSPDNRSREEINATIRAQLRSRDLLERDRFQLRALVSRQDVTKEDHLVAATYQTGDQVRFGRTNKIFGFERGDYATVIDRNAEKNLITVQRQRDGQLVTYDPAKTTSVQLYKEQVRSFAVGDRLQLTTSWREKGLANRQLGRIEALDEHGNATVRMDKDDRRVQWNLSSMRHVDYGYTMTSYSSQGTTVDRVLVQVDTGDSRVRSLNNKMMVYVAGSRGRHDLQIFTDAAADLPKSLSHVELKSTALSENQVRMLRKHADQKHQEKGNERAANQTAEFGMNL
jgi:conjugative relaxase-like TrwC/TraI family protein